METTDFEAERPRLTALAARILDSRTEADDVLQEAWLRLSRTTQVVADPPAWLTTVVTRLCLDHLRARTTRASYEAPLATAGADPEADALLAERVGDALQVVVDALAPAERAAFVLRDVFGYPFEAIAAALGRSETASRQLASRARRKVQGAPEPAADSPARVAGRDVVTAFLDAAHGGDLPALLSLLAPDVVLVADPVGQQLGAAARYDGAEAVAARFCGGRGAVLVTLDGDAGAAWFLRGEVKVAFAFHVDGGLVRHVELVADPDILATIDIRRPHRGRSRHRAGPAREPRQGPVGPAHR